MDYLKLRQSNAEKLTQLMIWGSSLHTGKDLFDNQDKKALFLMDGRHQALFKPIDHPVYDLWLVSCENV